MSSFALYAVLSKNINVVYYKYPFWQMTMENEKATYACLNYKEAYCPREIEDRSVCINSDIDELLDKLA